MSSEQPSFHEICASFFGCLEFGKSVIVIDGLDKLGQALECPQQQVRT